MLQTGLLSSVLVKLLVYTPAVNARHLVYLPVEKIARRAVGMLATSGADDKIVADSRGLVDKITGDNIVKNKRNNDKKKKVEGAADDAAGLGVSVSQLSFDRVLDNFEKLIELLKNEPKYNPNEAELKITALDALKGDMKAANKAVLNAAKPYNKALQDRDKELYAAKVGLVDLMVDVKEYVKNAFGVKDARYMQISGLKFTRPKK